MRFVPRASMIVLVGLSALIHHESLAQVVIEPSEQGAQVRLGEELFAEYVVASGHQPIVWPIYGPDGSAMTRSFPMGPQLSEERDDHPHHRSLWFTHGDVNGLDFWLEPSGSGRQGRKNHIRHREFQAMESGDLTGRITTVNDWMGGDAKICEDVRTLVFGGGDGGRWIDFTVEVSATDGDVTFGDTKEGSFAVRLAGTMKVDAKLGGAIVNSRGQSNAEAWGRPAEWVNYTGPVKERPAGVAIFSHPENSRPACRWHVRTYGLFAANPFGHRQFPPDEPPQGAVRLKQGDSLKLRYLVLFHRGDMTDEQLAEVFESYSSGRL